MFHIRELFRQLAIHYENYKRTRATYEQARDALQRAWQTTIMQHPHLQFVSSPQLHSPAQRVITPMLTQRKRFDAFVFGE